MRSGPVEIGNTRGITAGNVAGASAECKVLTQLSKLTPCSTETYNPPDLGANQAVLRQNDTNENYRNGLIPP